MGKKIFFFPYLACPGEEEDGAVQNGTVLSFLCFFCIYYLFIFLWGPKNGLQHVWWDRFTVKNTDDITEGFEMTDPYEWRDRFTVKNTDGIT